MKINRVFGVLKSGIQKQDKRIFIYLIFVGIATVFWLLNALGKNYTVDLDFPVKYTNLPTNKILVNTPPDKFTLQVSSYGFTILRHKMRLSFSPLVFNVNDFTKNMMETTQKSEYTILTNNYINELSDQLSSELKILSIRPDSIHFYFDQIIERKVKVYPNVDIDFKKQYQLSGPIKTKPDSVLVMGPRSILDTLKYVYTKYQKFESVSEAIQRNVSLEDIDNLKIDNQRIVLSIPIEEYTESQMFIPVSIENKPDSIKVKLFPNRVKVIFLVGLSRYAEIVPSDFDFSVSWDDINKGQNRLKITTHTIPPFIKSVKMIPDEVEYLIEK